MDKQHFDELVSNLKELIKQGALEGKNIYLFGHCNATEVLADCLLERGYNPVAILDNNVEKHGKDYRGIEIVSPDEIIMEEPLKCIVCIVARAYAAMAAQLRRLGYKGEIRKLVDYNSYAEYSLSDEAITRMRGRVERGCSRLEALQGKYPDCFRVLCPFSALGDIYLMMSYLPYFLRKREIEKCVIGVIGNACAEVVKLFGDYQVEVFSQKEMDETIQAALYLNDANSFIPHQDRPYVVNLHKALYIKKISLEQIYCCGVFGLPINIRPYKPICYREYPNMEEIPEGKSVILSPYAKSVTSLPESVWEPIVEDYKERGFECFTNVVGEERPLLGTLPISPKISEIHSVVERAGIFIGIRSGLCDVLRTAKAQKIALYPDYNYCDTKWKAIDMYYIDGWENIVVKDDFQWKKN